VTDADRAAVLAEILQAWQGENRSDLPQPNFTTSEMAAAWRVSKDVALGRLQRLEQQGLLASRKVRDGARPAFVFWKVEGDPSLRSG